MEDLECVCIHFEADFPLEGEIPFGRGNGSVEGGETLLGGGGLAFVREEDAGEDVVERVGTGEGFDTRELE